MAAYTNATQNIPQVFQDIMENDEKRTLIIKKARGMDVVPFGMAVSLGELNKDRKKNLVPSAERALRWNTDKGKAG